MDVKIFSKRMIELMPQCIRGFHSYESNYLSHGKISQPQFWALEYLSRKGPSLMSEIADFLAVSRPAATGLIDRLIIQKLVSRQVGEDDRRSVKVEITAKGKKIVSNIWDQKRRSLEKVFSQISSKDRRQHLEILERVVKVLSSGVCILLIEVIAFFSFSISAFASEQPPTALTLQEAYQLALKRSESIAINQEIIKEAEGRFLRSFSGILPQVNYEISRQWQDQSSNDSSGNRYRRFTLSQPLFSGFKEYAAISSTKALRKQRESELRRAQELLFTDVADAFYLILTYQEDLQALGDIHKALTDRFGELKRRQDLGRSRESEVASAEASLYKTEADQEAVRSQLSVGQQLLEFLTGKPFSGIQEDPLPTDSAKTMDEFVAKANQRADVQAARQAVIVAKKNVTIARAGFWPSVTLDGNSYDQRKGASENVDWDVTLNITVPLFNGGETVGSIKEAQALAKQSELLLSQTERLAVLDIQNSYTRFLEGQKRESALKKASDSAQRNFQLQERDYKSSLVNNLDVLQALEDWTDRRRDYIVIKNDAKRSYWNLKVAAGELI